MIAKEMRPDFQGRAVAISVYKCGRQLPHYHENTIEMIFCLSGGARVYNMHEEHLLRPGELLQTDMYDVHSVSALEGMGDNVMLSFHFDLSHPAFADKGYNLLYYICSSDEASETQLRQLNSVKGILLSMLLIHMQRPDSRKISELAGQALGIVREHFQYYDHINVDENMYPVEMRKRFERIMTIMLARYREKLTMREICDSEHISYNYLSRFFKDSSLKTYRNFLHEIRVYHSEHLLLCNPDMPVPEVGYAVGFSDPKIFYREFKAKHGHTPHQHRIWYRNYSREGKADEAISLDDCNLEIKGLVAERFAEMVMEHYEK